MQNRAVRKMRKINRNTYKVNKIKDEENKEMKIIKNKENTKFN